MRVDPTNYFIDGNRDYLLLALINYFLASESFHKKGVDCIQLIPFISLSKIQKIQNKIFDQDIIHNFYFGSIINYV